MVQDVATLLKTTSDKIKTPGCVCVCRFMLRNFVQMDRELAAWSVGLFEQT